MVREIFSIYDKKAMLYSTPFFLLQAGQALRELDQMVQDPKTTVSKYPDDFALYKIGIFNGKTGKIESLDMPEFIQEAIVFKNQEKENPNV